MKTGTRAAKQNEAQEEEIAKNAYLIWENEGRPEGHELDHWLQAKSQLTGEKTPRQKRETASAS